MRSTSTDIILSRLAEMPFLDRPEVMSLTGLSQSTVYKVVRRLEDDGLITSVPHTPEYGAHTRRYSLTAEGVRILAGKEGGTVDAILRSRPVSAQWQRLLLERLDALAVVYSVIETISGVVAPISVRLYRSHPLDAVVTLSGGRTIGIVRRGRTSDGASFDRRLHKLLRGQLPAALLVVAPDEVLLRSMLRRLARLRVHVFITLENEVITALVDDAIWQRPGVSTRFDIQAIVSRFADGGHIPVEMAASRASIPVAPPVCSSLADTPSHLLPSGLNPADKRALDLIADWPGITPANLRTLLGLKPSRFSQIVGRLREADLIRTITLTGHRFVPSDRALVLLARRDRTSVAVAWRRWSAGDVTRGMLADWRDVPGRRLRQLLRHIHHTHAVHAYLASTITSARSEGWMVVKLDPPHRAARHFRHRDGQRSVHPDAFFMLRSGGDTRAFLLEYERRAIRPSTMRRRVAPYVNYYATTRPLDDHGVLPSVLIIVEDEIIAPHFRRETEREMAGKGVEFPFRLIPSSI